MGKKRPNQWQIVPDEGGATDYKTWPNHPREADADDRRLSRALEGPFDRGQPVPPKVLEPVAERARARELWRQNQLQRRDRSRRTGRRHH